VEHNGKPVDLVAHAIERGWTPQRAEDKAELWQLRASRPGPGVGVPGGLAYATTSPQVSEAVIEAAVLDAARHQFRLDDDDFYTDPSPDRTTRVRRVPLAIQKAAQRELRARYTDQVQQAAHTIFKGRIAPRQIFQAAFNAWGHRRELRPVRRAVGAADVISNVLANVLNKFALMGYLFVEQAYREFCAIRSVNDFKPAKSINLLGDVMFKKFGPTGELANFSLGDQAFANQAQPYGGILTIPWTHLVNDDLGILTGVPRKIGQGAGLALNDVIWTLGRPCSPAPSTATTATRSSGRRR
jgi:hypothetical protein